MAQTYESIDAYINTFPEDIQQKLQSIRQTIAQEAPDATEAISYAMPTFKLGGKNLIHFAAWKDHLALYPTPSGTEAFKNELDGYQMSKGTIQLPLDQPIPHDLIKRIVRFRADEMQQ